MNIETSGTNVVPRITLTGSLNTNTASQLESTLEPLLEKAEAITFDFADLEYVSSAGLRVLMMAYKRLNGGTVSIENATDDVREVFDITGFSDIFSIS